jgi:hypothetical protein
MKRYQVGFELELKEPLSVLIEAGSLGAAAQEVETGIRLVYKDAFDQEAVLVETQPGCRVIHAHKVEGEDRPRRVGPERKAYTVYFRWEDDGEFRYEHRRIEALSQPGRRFWKTRRFT